MNDPLNPYSPPSGQQHQPVDSVPSAVVPAGQGARFANFIIDYIVQFAFGLAFGFAAVEIGGEAGLAFIESVPGLLIGIPVLLAYYFVLEATTSKTLGKLITGTKVVNEDGGKPTVGQIAGRTFCRLIPFEAFSFFGTPTRGWHDRIPKTFVVKTR